MSSIRRNNRKHDKVLMLAKSKLNSIEILIYQALTDMKLSHNEFIRILKEKDKYKKIKENLANANEKVEEIDKIMRLNCVNSNT